MVQGSGIFKWLVWMSEHIDGNPCKNPDLNMFNVIMD